MTWQTIVESVLRDYRQNSGYTNALCCVLCNEIEKKNITKEITQLILERMQHLHPRDALIEACRDFGLKVDL